MKDLFGTAPSNNGTQGDDSDQVLRSVPNRDDLYALFCEDSYMMARVLFTMIEVPALREAYPSLNLDDVLVLGEFTQRQRIDQLPEFRKALTAKRKEGGVSDGIYKMFTWIYDEAYPQLRKQRGRTGLGSLGREDSDLDKLWNELNPFGRRRNLKERLELIKPGVVERIFRELRKPVFNYWLYKGKDEFDKPLPDESVRIVTPEGSGTAEGFWYLNEIIGNDRIGIYAFADGICNMLENYPRHVIELPKESSKPQNPTLF
jgi:hypothetical protein